MSTAVSALECGCWSRCRGLLPDVYGCVCFGAWAGWAGADAVRGVRPNAAGAAAADPFHCIIILGVFA